MKFPYDKSSKWLIQHYGGTLLRLAGVVDVVAWQAQASQVVQPTQLPDGLLEVQRAGQEHKELFVLEIATYPDRRVPEQLARDAMLVYLDRSVWPEVLAVVLCPKGQVRVAPEVILSSASSASFCRVSWRVVELWTLQAEDLLRLDDPGLAPWITLTQFAGPPETLLRQCRDLIDRKAPASEHENLLAVSQVLAGLRYNDVRMLASLGGKQAMIESPVLQEFLAERSHELILRILRDRFGAPPEEIVSALQLITDAERLGDLNVVAARCPNLASFQAALGATRD